MVLVWFETAHRMTLVRNCFYYAFYFYSAVSGMLEVLFLDKTDAGVSFIYGHKKHKSIFALTEFRTAYLVYLAEIYRF